MGEGSIIGPTDPDDHIGEWVRREYDKQSYQDTKAHRVESRIGSRLIVNCGKQLRLVTLAKAKNHLRAFSSREEAILNGVQPCETCS